MARIDIHAIRRAAVLFFLAAALLLPGARALAAESPQAQDSPSSSGVRTYDIPAQDAATALRAWASQSGTGIVFPDAWVSGKTAPPVVGTFTRREALALLTNALGLEVVGQAVELVTLAVASGAPAAVSEFGFREEVTVTANKREENVRDVAGSVTPVTGRDLDHKGAQGFSDYLVGVPGVAFHETQPGAGQITMRGVTTTTFTDQGQQTTGFYVNDVPTTEPYYSTGVPDIDPFDVDRVEVLRGPQGTLFGSSSMGGAVNFIAARAKLDRFEGRIEAGPSATGGENGPGWNGGVKGMVNIPLVKDKVAVRLVGTYRALSGYVNNVGINEKRADSADFADGRFSFEWQVTPRFRVSELSLYSRSNSDDAALSYYDLGGFKRSTHVPEPYRLATTIHSVRAQYALDKALVTANYAYVNKDQFMSLDLTESLAAVFNGLVPYASAPQDAFARANLVEFRASSTQRQRVEWLAGLSFGHHDEDFHATAYAPGAASAIETLFAGYFGAGIGAKVAPGDVWADLDSPTNGNETAAFGEVTYRFSEHWSAMGGGRWFHDRITTVNDQQGFLTFLSTGGTSSYFEQTYDEAGFTPRGAVTYKRSPNFLVYGLVSTGYRFGGANLAPPSVQYPSPESYGSDSLVNYEVGTRMAWLDQRISLDLTPYYIDWRDIQLRQRRPDGFAYATNAGRARNVGLDVEFHATTGKRFALDTAVGLLDARLVDDITSGGIPVAAGARMPASPRFTSAVTGTGFWQGRYTPSVSVTHRYVGESPLDVVDSARQGDYNVVDVRGRMVLGGVRWELFVNNLFDSEGVVTAYPKGAYPLPPLGAYYLRPRTAGMRLVYDIK